MNRFYKVQDDKKLYNRKNLDSVFKDYVSLMYDTTLEDFEYVDEEYIELEELYSPKVMELPYFQDIVDSLDTFNNSSVNNNYIINYGINRFNVSLRDLFRLDRDEIFVEVNSFISYLKVLLDYYNINIDFDVFDASDGICVRLLYEGKCITSFKARYRNFYNEINKDIDNSNKYAYIGLKDINLILGVLSKYNTIFNYILNNPEYRISDLINYRNNIEGGLCLKD